jgi:FkbM family methyltransferase
MIGNINDWFKNNGDYTHRLNYNLNEESIVFDLGGYEGWFVEQMTKKFNCYVYCFEPFTNYANNITNKYIKNSKVKVYPLGISDSEKTDIIYINNDASSMHIKSGTPVEIKTTTIDKIMADEGVKFIDLLKINIEGEEYPFLEYAIKNSLLKKFGNIQVQFHMFETNYQERYNNIIIELEKTHELTYIYPFVWENWKLK